MIEAVIFDMDGVLLDSEPFWQEAEMEVFASVGVHLTREQCMQTMGLPVKDVVVYRYSEKPWQNKSKEQVSKEIMAIVERLIRKNAVPLPGVFELLNFFKALNIPVALASSSSHGLIQAVLSKFGLANTFSVVHSADLEEYGKPHPAVFLNTAKELRADPLRCLVIEDSLNGLIAAKAARMKTIVLPMEAQWEKTSFEIADFKLKSLTEFSAHHWSRLNA